MKFDKHDMLDSHNVCHAAAVSRPVCSQGVHRHTAFTALNTATRIFLYGLAIQSCVCWFQPFQLFSTAHATAGF